MYDRPLRGCEICGQVDTAPRHVVAVEDGTAGVPSAEMVTKLVQGGISEEGLAALLDPTTSVRHMDCCAQIGCPAESGAQCGDEKRAGSGKQNDELLLHISGRKAVDAERIRVESVRLDKPKSIEGGAS